MGVTGLPWILGPTGGYLIGFIAAAYITGALAQRGWDRTPLKTTVAMTLGTAAIFIPGLLWLGMQARLFETFAIEGIDIASTENVLRNGLWIYLPGAVVKIALAAACLPFGWKILAACEKWRPRD